MLGYLSADIICSQKRTVFRERSSRKTVSFSAQIMSVDKYPSIISPQMEAIMFIILQIFFATRAVLKMGVYSRISPSFRWGIFGHVTCSDQLRASEKIWWIIILNIFRNHTMSQEYVDNNLGKDSPAFSTYSTSSFILFSQVCQTGCNWYFSLIWSKRLFWKWNNFRLSFN